MWHLVCCSIPELRCILLQKRLVVDLELFNDFLESMYIKATYATEGDTIHVVSTDQWEICLYEPTRMRTPLFFYCTLFEKRISRYDQDGHHSAANNDAFTGKFERDDHRTFCRSTSATN